MTQSELDRTVADATGETVTTIRELGFDMADPDVVHHDPEPTDLDARTIDWDALHARRAEHPICLDCVHDQPTRLCAIR